MNLFKQFKEFVQSYYFIAVHEENIEYIDAWMDMCEGAYYFCLLNELAPVEQLQTFWLRAYHAKFVRLSCSSDFREAERKRLPKKQLTQAEITERNRRLEKILNELAGQNGG